MVRVRYKHVCRYLGIKVVYCYFQADEFGTVFKIQQSKEVFSMRKHTSIYQVLIGITFPMLLFCFIISSPQPAAASHCGPEDDVIT